MLNKIVPVVLIAATSTLVVPRALGDWPSYRHDPARTGNAPDDPVLSNKDNVKTLTVTRSFPSGTQGEGGSFEASPIVANVVGTDGTVVAMVFVGSTSGIFYALRADTLEPVWQYPRDAKPNDARTGALLGSCGLGGNGSFGRYGIHASATFTQIGDHDAVIFGAPDPGAEPLDPTTNPKIGYGSARLFALDANTGQSIWMADGMHDGSEVVAHVTDCVPLSLGDGTGTELNLHERIANSSPLVLSGKVYVGVHGSGDDPLQKGKVVAVDLLTGQSVRFTHPYVSTGGPNDNMRGGAVWNSLATDGTSVYITTGNTRNPYCKFPYVLADGTPDLINCPDKTLEGPLEGRHVVTEPSPNYGLSMVSVNKDTGNVNWVFQPVPFERDGDPDWAAGATVVHASCGTVITSVMKDGWAYGINPDDGSCKWQFPQTTSAPPSPAPPRPQACVFGTDDHHVHGDDGYRQPAAVSRDPSVVIMRTGGEALIDDISNGYARLHALDACADDAHRVKWITDPLVRGEIMSHDAALGAPTVTGGIVYLAANNTGFSVQLDNKVSRFRVDGQLLAIADPTVYPELVLGSTCSDPTFKISDCKEADGHSVVPIAPVLKRVPLPDRSDAAHLRKEPVIANGRLYVGTSQNLPQGGHIYTIEPSNVTPLPKLGMSISVTATPSGPDICIDGEGFTPISVAQIIYSNIPGRTAPFAARKVTASVRSDGTFSKPDISHEGELLQSCSNAQTQQEVTIDAIDNINGTVSTTIPTAYWCRNALLNGFVPTNFNGSCR